MKKAIETKEDAILNLLENSNMPIIKDLFTMSYFASGEFMAALCRFKPTQIHPKIVFDIIELMSEHFDELILRENKQIIDVFLNRLKNTGPEFTKCFMKLVDLGATTDYLSMSRRIPTDAFFYYVDKHDLPINYDVMIAAFYRERHDESICDWIFNAWLDSNTIYDLKKTSRIAIAAHYAHRGTFFARCMQKISYQHDLNMVAASVIMNCHYVDDTDAIIEHVFIHIEEFRMLKMIKSFASIDQDARHRYGSTNRMTEYEKCKIISFLADDEIAFQTFKKIEKDFRIYNPERYDELIEDLSLFLVRFNVA